MEPGQPIDCPSTDIIPLTSIAVHTNRQEPDVLMLELLSNVGNIQRGNYSLLKGRVTVIFWLEPEQPIDCPSTDIIPLTSQLCCQYNHREEHPN